MYYTHNIASTVALVNRRLIATPWRTAREDLLGHDAMKGLGLQGWSAIGTNGNAASGPRTGLFQATKSPGHQRDDTVGHQVPAAHQLAATGRASRRASPVGASLDRCGMGKRAPCPALSPGSPGFVGLTLAFEPHGIAPTMTMKSGELEVDGPDRSRRALDLSHRPRDRCPGVGKVIKWSIGIYRARRLWQRCFWRQYRGISRAEVGDCKGEQLMLKTGSFS